MSHHTKPVFLFAYANDRQGSLQLSEEERRLRNALSFPHDQGQIEVAPLGHANLDDIYDSFNRFHNRVALFHYGGHSDDTFLHLEDTQARSAALSTLIGQQQNLQLVFLNGCANVAQVRELFAKQVKAVIATRVPIDDQRALEFSEHFYRALARGKTIGEAFDTAKSYIHNENPELTIEHHWVIPEEFQDDGFPWGIYTQDRSALDWKLPDGSPAESEPVNRQPVPIDLPDINQELVLLGYEGMATFNEAFYGRTYASYRTSPNSRLFKRMWYDILDEFPTILSIHIRELFTAEGKQEGRQRLRIFSEAYETLGRLLCAVALADLWDAVATHRQNGNFAVQDEQLADIKKYLAHTPQSQTPIDYFWLLRTVVSILEDNQVGPYVTELTTITTKFRAADEFYEAYNFLERNIRQRVLAGNIPNEEVESLCVAAELHFGKLLQQCSFLVNYQLVTVKVISVDNPRRAPQPSFIHQAVILKGRDIDIIDAEELSLDSTGSNNSVFITRAIETDGLPLNLSPFLVDRNAYKAEDNFKPKIYFLDGLGKEKLFFLHADTLHDETNHGDFTVIREAEDRTYKNLDTLFGITDLFCRDMGLPLH